MHPIWTHCGCLRFASVESGSILIWEMAFTLTPAPRKVASFPIPQETGGAEELLLLPSPFRLAYTVNPKILVWDVNRSELLLDSGHISSQPYFKKPSFSHDGHFFACTTGYDVYLWKESLVGYSFHQQFPVTSTSIFEAPFFSPNGESFIIFATPKIQLWHTND